jgi:rieske iron-sulfur protein
LAYPMQPQSNVVRDGSRLNQVLLIRLDPAQLTPEARANSAEGVVVYSAICTHQGCDVSQWKTDTKTLLCVCHGSEYDPKDRAKVTFGPAPRRLAMLPVKVENGVVIVASAFKGKPGFMDL